MTLNEHLTRQALHAYLLAHAWITQREKNARRPEMYDRPTFDDVLEANGITWAKDRPLWLAYEREVRRRANLHAATYRTGPRTHRYAS